MEKFIWRLPLIVLYVLQAYQLLIKAVCCVQAAAPIRCSNQTKSIEVLLHGVNNHGSP